MANTRRRVGPPPLITVDLAAQCRKVLDLSNELEPNLRDIAEKTQAIPTLSDAVLQTVNSASLGLQRTVHAVDQAVALLGARRMCDVIEEMLGEDPAELKQPHSERRAAKRTA